MRAPNSANKTALVPLPRTTGPVLPTPGLIRSPFPLKAEVEIHPRNSIVRPPGLMLNVCTPRLPVSPPRVAFEGVLEASRPIVNTPAPPVVLLRLLVFVKTTDE